MKHPLIIMSISLTLILASCNDGFPNSSGVTSDFDSSLSSSLIVQEDLGWNLVWADEFDYTGLPNPSKWGYDVGGSGWGNNELQYYTENDLDNAKVDNGNLIITARKEVMQNNQYTSARLVTRGKADFLYGRMESRAKLPSGRGTWPAIWMLPTDWEYGGWPTSGEIDIMEHVGYDPNVVHATIHTATYNHSKGTQVGESMTLPDVFNTFHEYAIEWEPGEIRAYINDVQYATFAFDPDDIADGPSHLAWPFDKDFHFIFNIAVGGSWGGVQGVNDDIFPTSMTVDYVRVYQKDYAQGDDLDPSAVREHSIEKLTGNTIAIQWNKSVDNRAVKSYMVRANGEVIGTPSVNALYITNLTPETLYNFTITAVDFNNNLSYPYAFSLQTLGYPSINQRIEAEAYTSQSGVEFQTTSDTGGGSNAGWLDRDDYLEYLISIPLEGSYTLSARVASQSAAGQLAILADNSLKTTMTLPITGGWQTWQTATSTPFTLPAGVVRLSLRVAAPGFNLNYLTIQPA
jgi:beta-glucanase (GH16 family)